MPLPEHAHDLEEVLRLRNAYPSQSALAAMLDPYLPDGVDAVPEPPPASLTELRGWAKRAA